MTRHIIAICIVLVCIAVACSDPSVPPTNGYSSTCLNGCTD